MTFFSSLFKSKPPAREASIRFLVDFLLKISTVNKYFDQFIPRKGPARDLALAECHALRVFQTTFALWAALGSKDKVLPILDVFQPAFVGSLSPSCREIFLKIVNEREQEYMEAVPDALSSGDSTTAMKLSALMLRRISGDTDSQDIFGALRLWSVIVKDTISLKQTIEKLQEEAPSLFSNL